MKGETTLYPIKRKFSWEGFCKIDILDALVEGGLSRTKAKSLFNSGAVKVWDTKVTDDGNHFKWYKRRANQTELLEIDLKDDMYNTIFYGRATSMVVHTIPFSLAEKVFYRLREIKEILQDKFNKERGII